LTDGQEKIAIHIKYGDIEKEFTATLENAWLLLKRFFSEFVPSFEIANSLWLSVDLNKLAKSCQGLIAFSKDGPSLMVSNSRLTDNETLLLWLLAQHLGHELGIVTREFVTKSELKLRLGKSAKIASTRLGELVKNGLITKIEGENFRITTLGVVQMQNELLPRIKAKVAG
jgi:DNA-binding MarR family transcriptional regulator